MVATPFRRGSFDELPDAPRLPHPFAETRAQTVIVDSPGFGRTQAHVRTFGAGPPLFLIHGLMTSSYSWRYVLSALGRHFTLYVPDLPGNGRTRAPAAPLHADAMADWIAALQNALGIRGCAVIGNSMGGYLMMRLALRDPQAMSRLVNIHSPGVPEARLYALQAALAIPGARALLDWMVRRSPHRWVHKNVHYWDESLKSLEEAREYGAPLSTAAGRAAFISHLRDTMAPKPMRAFQRRLLELKQKGDPFPVPLLLLYAERDPMVPPRMGDVFAARVPSAKYLRLAGASHFAHVDAPEKLLPPVLEFLQVPAK